MHTVGPKESISSIGRMYEVNGRVLANYNNIDYDKGLTVGQVLKIPPKGTTLEQVAQPVKAEAPKTQPPVVKTESNNETGSPVYHTVGKKETLFHITTLYPGISVDDLKKWNNLTGDGVNEGAKLIVGYSKGAAETKMAPVEKAEKEKPVVVKEAEKKESKKTEPVETKPVIQTGKDFKGGVFKTVYESQNSNGVPVDQQGAAGVFKSTSGWTDGKYYCLYNNAVPGTIIKITNTANEKFVFAKVLDAIPDIKQNNGLLICISNAAATELGAAEGNFNCAIKYSK